MDQNSWYSQKHFRLMALMGLSKRIGATIMLPFFFSLFCSVQFTTIQASVQIHHHYFLSTCERGQINVTFWNRIMYIWTVCKKMCNSHEFLTDRDRSYVVATFSQQRTLLHFY